MKDHIKLIISRNDPKFLDGLDTFRDYINDAVQDSLFEYDPEVRKFADIDPDRDSLEITKDLTSGYEFDVFLQKALLNYGLNGLVFISDDDDEIDSYISEHPVLKSVCSYLDFMERIYEDATTTVEEDILHKDMISILEKLGYKVTR